MCRLPKLVARAHQFLLVRTESVVCKELGLFAFLLFRVNVLHIIASVTISLPKPCLK